LGIWKLRGLRRGVVRDKCPHAVGRYDATLKCLEMQKWRGELLNSMWINVNKEIKLKKLLGC